MVCPRAPRGKKKTNKQTDPHGEDKKKNQHKLRIKYTKCVYFGLKHKLFSNRIHSLGK